MLRYDFAVIGGGVVGLATTMTLGQRYQDARILVLEKESSWANHQTGRNSGVIHSGLYYQPGSLKAKLCREGNASMVEFCQKHNIDHEVCGKVIVATEPEELPLLENLYQRGLQNGLKVSKISGDEVQEIEPYVNALAGIRVPSTGIVSYKDVCRTYAEIISHQGGSSYLNNKVQKIIKTEAGYRLETNESTYEASFLINCAGLYSDRIAQLDTVALEARIIPMRGEYYELKPERRYLVKHLIYPLPHPVFPVLGVHFTRMVDGSVHAGPNAVVCFKREGYRKTDFDIQDFLDIITYPGFWKFASKYLEFGIQEMIRSMSKLAFLRSLQRMIPEIQADDLVPSPSGVRAQALMHDGSLVNDFLLIQRGRALHVCNAPSPAATASLEISKMIVDQIGQVYGR